MDHLQVSVLALRETIDRQEDRISDLETQRSVAVFLLAFVVALFFALLAVAQPMFC